MPLLFQNELEGLMFLSKTELKDSVNWEDRDLLKVALPLVITSASFTILHYCDRVFLARYSPVALQAAVPAGIVADLARCGWRFLADSRREVERREAFRRVGQAPGQQMGVYLPAVVPTLPAFDDTDRILRWSFRDSRAQGSVMH